MPELWCRSLSQRRCVHKVRIFEVIGFGSRSESIGRGCRYRMWRRILGGRCVRGPGVLDDERTCPASPCLCRRGDACGDMFHWFSRPHGAECSRELGYLRLRRRFRHNFRRLRCLFCIVHQLPSTIIARRLRSTPHEYKPHLPPCDRCQRDRHPRMLHPAAPLANAIPGRHEI